MNHIERAALLIDREYGPCNDNVNHRGQEPVHAAEALADAGLLITDEDRDVLDAADALLLFNDTSHVCPDYDTCCRGAEDRLLAAVRARKEAQR